MQAARQTDSQLQFQKVFVDPYGTKPELQQVIRNHKGPCHQDGADSLGDYSSYSSSGNSHVQEDNSNDIQNNIEKATDDQIIKRTLGIS